MSICPCAQIVETRGTADRKEIDRKAEKLRTRKKIISNLFVYTHAMLTISETGIACISKRQQALFFRTTVMTTSLKNDTDLVPFLTLRFEVFNLLEALIC
jgi:hypothetical protein